MKSIYSKILLAILVFVIAIIIAIFVEPFEDDEETIEVAAFNIQVFGKTKASKPEVIDILSSIIRNYDIVAVQEIRDSSQTALPALVEGVNSTGMEYKFIVGERLGRTTSKEQYAYLYNNETIELIGSPYTYQEPEGTDTFHREPYTAYFRVKNSSFDFVLMTIHIDPDEATHEINGLPAVIEDAKPRFPGEEDFIVMGDFNADCTYFDEEGPSPLRSSEYHWLINNTFDTTTKTTDCTYDRIVITTPTLSDFSGDAGVFRFDLTYNLTNKNTTAVSDHYPVYAVFWSNRDDD